MWWKIYRWSVAIPLKESNEKKKKNSMDFTCLRGSLLEALSRNIMFYFFYSFLFLT